MPSTVAIWIWICAYLNCAGWTLSALHRLDKTGYTVAFAIGLLALWFWKQKTGARIFPQIQLNKYRRRFCRGFPLAFLVLVVLAFLGGALHGAGNYDALAYRTSRVLHWLEAGQWFWIPSDFPRLNTRTAGFEWLTAPQFLFLKTDRFVFLLNIISFLLLPGRVFAVLTRLGVRPRAAWHWMWLFPSGYGYVLQAGSVVNDMFGAVIVLIAIEFALRAAREKRVEWLWVSGLAAALMTAVKAFNVVLLLPWGIAVLPALPMLVRRPLASLAVILIAAGSSMVPTSILNAKYCGDWTGANIEQTPIGGGHALLRCVVNVPNLVLGNLVPPVFPIAKNWESFVDKTLPDSVKQTLKPNFEGGQARFALPELQVEETSGIGCGLSLLLLGLLLVKIRSRELGLTSLLSMQVLVPLGAWAGIGVFMVRVGISGPARYLLPFYILLLAPLLAGAAAGSVFRKRLWRSAGFAVFAVAALLLVVSPARPLWPAVTVLQAMDANSSDHRLIRRLWNVYSVYGSRAEAFAPVLAALPPDASTLGLVTFDEPEASLWRPFGSRRIVHVQKADTAESVRQAGLKYALVSEAFLANHARLSSSEWLIRYRAEKISEFHLRLHAGREPETWFLARFP